MRTDVGSLFRFHLSAASELASNATLFVGGLSDTVTEEQIRGMFALFGELISVKHLANRRCAFVQFSQASAAKAAMTVLQDQVLTDSGLLLTPFLMSFCLPRTSCGQDSHKYDCCVRHLFADVL